MLNITDISMYANPYKSSATKAYVSMTIDNAIVIHGIKIIEKPDGTMFIGMPSKKVEKSGEPMKYADIAHPITKDVREYITKTILEEYNKKSKQL